MKIVILDSETVSRNDVSLEGITVLGESIVYGFTPNEQVAEKIGDADAVICNKCLITEEVFSKCKNLKYVGLFATGYNNVDLSAADRHDAVVCNVPAYSTNAVAQHTFALILNYFSKIREYAEKVDEGGWVNYKLFSYFGIPTYELAGKTVEIKFSSTKGISDDKQNTLKTALEKDFPDNNIEVYESNDVAASSGMNFFFKCLAACALAMVITIIYIGFRFKKIGGISAGVFSVVALAHDMCMVYGCFVICRFDINANFMAVLLTILGYSINATIIIYDRIRENENLLGNKMELEDLVNLSITQTMGRSIHTTVTTVLAMATVCIVCVICGVTSILSFAFPLIIGMISGVYSSNCIAPTLWVHWKKHQAKKSHSGSKTGSAKKKASRR